MTNLNVTAVRRPGIAPLRRAARAVAGTIAVLLAPLAQAYRARRDAELLMSLNDDLLKDIGVTRCEIDFIVGAGRHHAHGKMGLRTDHHQKPVGVKCKGPRGVRLVGANLLTSRCQEASAMVADEAGADIDVRGGNPMLQAAIAKSTASSRRPA